MRCPTTLLVLLFTKRQIAMDPDLVEPQSSRIDGAIAHVEPQAKDEYSKEAADWLYAIRAVHVRDGPLVA